MRLTQTPQAAQAAAGAATLNAEAGVVTTEALVTAAGASYTLTLKCNALNDVNNVVLASLANGTNTQGDPDMTLVKVNASAKTITFTVVNRHATQALNGNLQISYAVLN